MCNGFKMKFVECPRDAMQGIKKQIPTQVKITYANLLLDVGFDILDVGSFVSPKAIPQMSDTKQVLEHLKETPTKLLVIVANHRGAVQGIEQPKVNYLGYPFSISEEFQKRNTNATLNEAFDRVKDTQELCVKNNKTLCLYFSMAFGNPYNEAYHEDQVCFWAEKMSTQLGIKSLTLADTIGSSNPKQIHSLVNTLKAQLPNLSLGLHLHSNPLSASEKISAAFKSNCDRLDSALLGLGGCPMAKDDLVGNINTELVIDHLQNMNINHALDLKALEKAKTYAKELFSTYY